MIYKILQDWFHLKEGEEIDTHDSNQQIYLALMVETGRAEIVKSPESTNP
jgi:hypothetical protein